MEQKLPKQIWRLGGSNSRGPNVVVLGGTHGDEMPGIEAVRRILDTFGLLDKPAGNYKLNGVNCNLCIGFGNPEAILRRRRGVSDRNLNRSFVPELLRDKKALSRGDLDVVRAQELAPLFRQTDFLIDLHAAGGDAEPFAALNTMTPIHEKMCRRLPIKHVLTDPHDILTKLDGKTAFGTTDYYVEAFGGSEWSMREYGKRHGLGFCFEAGNEDDLKVVDRTVAVTLDLLVFLKAITPGLAKRVPGFAVLKPAPEQKTFALIDSLAAKHDKFTYAPGMFKNWRAVKKGTVLGTYGDGKKEIIGKDCYLVFPNAPRKIRKGGSLCYLAVRA